MTEIYRQKLSLKQTDTTELDGSQITNAWHMMHFLKSNSMI